MALISGHSLWCLTSIEALRKRFPSHYKGIPRVRTQSARTDTIPRSATAFREAHRRPSVAAHPRREDRASAPVRARRGAARRRRVPHYATVSALVLVAAGTHDSCAREPLHMSPAPEGFGAGLGFFILAFDRGIVARNVRARGPPGLQAEVRRVPVPVLDRRGTARGRGPRRLASLPFLRRIVGV